jgi:hypothetical protein
MTPQETAEWFDQVTNLIENDEIEAAERLIADAERVTSLAKALLRPQAVTPAKARLQRYPCPRPGKQV